MDDGWEEVERTVCRSLRQDETINTELRSQENFQKLEIKIAQMVKASTAGLMPKVSGNEVKPASDRKHLTGPERESSHLA